MEEQCYLRRTAVAVLGNAWSYRAGCRLRASVIYSAETRRTRAEKILHTGTKYEELGTHFRPKKKMMIILIKEHIETAPMP